MRRALAAPLACAALAAACATIGSAGQGDLDLPTTGVGPFRKLTATEVKGVAPLVLEDVNLDFREPAALAVDPSDTSSTSVFLYAVAHEGGSDAIVRTRADDARSFFGTSNDAPHRPAVVLAADQAWEGASLGGPSAVRASGKVLLYYAGAGGIGVAQSDDGLAFQEKSPGPVLGPDPTVTWETAAPAAPSVALLPDGRFRMLYAAGLDIGEAESTDGVTWHRLDADPSTPALDPVLGPGPTVDPSTLAPGQKPPFDTAQVADPCLVPRVTAAGRLQFRVLYTGYTDPPGTAGRNGTIGFAARYGDAGGLARQAGPVYSVSKHEAAPALFEWGIGMSMLYVQEDDTSTTSATGVAVAAAVAPGTVTLDLPGAFAAAP